MEVGRICNPGGGGRGDDKTGLESEVKLVAKEEKGTPGQPGDTGKESRWKESRVIGMNGAWTSNERPFLGLGVRDDCFTTPSALTCSWFGRVGR